MYQKCVAKCDFAILGVEFLYGTTPLEFSVWTDNRRVDVALEFNQVRHLTLKSTTERVHRLQTVKISIHNMDINRTYASHAVVSCMYDPSMLMR